MIFTKLSGFQVSLLRRARRFATINFDPELSRPKPSNRQKFHMFRIAYFSLFALSGSGVYRAITSTSEEKWKEVKEALDEFFLYFV